MFIPATFRCGAFTKVIFNRRIGRFYRYVFRRTRLLTTVIDKLGNVVIRYAYDAWGNSKIITTEEYSTLASLNPFRYRGYYYDVEIGLYYLQTRYYDPQLGRFISIDNVAYVDFDNINGINLYAYCHNNPIMYVDPNGCFAILSFLIGLGVAALIGAGVAAVSYVSGQLIDYAITGKFKWSWGDFLGATIGGAIGGMISYVLPYIGLNSAIFGAFMSGAVTTTGTMIGENVADHTGYSAVDIVLSSVTAGAFSALSVGVMDKIRIIGLNAGRGSYSAVSKQMYTKFQRGIIESISIKTFGKMLVAEAYSGMLGSVFEEIYDYLGIYNFILNRS